MAGWELLICPSPGRSSRRYRIGAGTLVFAAFGVILTMLSAGWLGWQVGQQQATATMSRGHTR
ncbi:MAG: hypothetical protein OXU20_10010 [Myxococcales bacterium]|nr:hypothetical protein [Myxococcales bacterium]MDD9964623.1 hypothetical protein [Myxococcales bacterium]